MDDEGYEDGDWGLCVRCGKRLKKYEDVEGLCATCDFDVMVCEYESEQETDQHDAPHPT